RAGGCGEPSVEAGAAAEAYGGLGMEAVAAGACAAVAVADALAATAGGELADDAYREMDRRGLPVAVAVGRGLQACGVDHAGAQEVQAVGQGLVVDRGGQTRRVDLGRHGQPSVLPVAPHLNNARGDPRNR